MLELSGIIILGIMAQWIAWKLKIPAILPLILTGLFIGPFSTLISEDGNKWIEPVYNGEFGLFPGESLFNPATWVNDMSLQIDGNGDGDRVDEVDQEADLYAYKTVVVNASGSATAMVAGYEGLGKSSASGGALMFFDLRSVGASAANSSGVTGSNYRYVVRN